MSLDRSANLNHQEKAAALENITYPGQVQTLFLNTLLANL
jgi:hypothetical protein